MVNEVIESVAEKTTESTIDTKAQEKNIESDEAKNSDTFKVTCPQISVQFTSFLI